ncbi:MAG: hypothetical protein PHY93_11625 [Bacteriovorax sp.]|nr:hypothetical protein [Bacteriovorax sp.]
MKYIIAVLLLASFQVHSETQFTANKFILKTSTNNGLKKIEIDLNQDNKTDRIETYRGEELVSLVRDSKFSGKFDEWTAYFPFVSEIRPTEILEMDTNGDGKIDRIETFYKNIPHNLLIVNTKVDSLFTGKFDKEFTVHSKLSSKKDEVNCIATENIADFKILKLTKDIGEVNMLLEDGLYRTDWGYKIHQSCLEKWGANTFLSILKSTMSKGFQCLGNLAKNNINNNSSPNGALNNLKGLEYLTSTNNISIVCNQKNYSWDGIDGHASVSPGEMIKESGVKHPFISINETNPKDIAKPTEDEKNELSDTLFHEQLHNLEIRHGENIEFPYACSTCCISEAKGAQKENACKICSGVYTGISDKNYLNDLIKWGRTSYKEEESARAINKYQKEFPHDRWALFAYVDSSSGIFSPVGIQMAKILKEKYKKITKDEEDHLKIIEKYESIKSLTNPETAKMSKLVAEANIALYFERDSKKVLINLEKNKVAIKELFNNKTTNETEKYIGEDIKKKITDLLDDIWLDHFPSNNSSESSHALHFLREIGVEK